MNEDQTPLFPDTQVGENRFQRSDMPHLATVSHDSRFWDVYVEFHEDVRNPGSQRRAALLFSPADSSTSGQESVRTAVILVERDDDAVVKRAQTFGDHQLVALLRSVL